MHWCPEAQLAGSDAQFPLPVTPASVHFPCLASAVASPNVRALDFSELSPPAAMICLHLLSLKPLCSTLPGLSCSRPLFHEHWISMGPALWFHCKVPVVCLPHLSAVTNLASGSGRTWSPGYIVSLGPAIEFRCRVPAVCHPGL